MINFKDKIPENADGFIILSYAVKDKNTPTYPTRMLIRKTLQLLKSRPAAKVIMSTGDNQFLGKTNAEIMKEYAISIGIPERNILLEDKSRNTYENLQLSGIIIRKNKLKCPVLVLLDLHAPRAVAIADTLGWQKLGFISVRAKGEPAYGYKYFQTYSRLTIYIYEKLAYIYCKIKGQII